MRLKIVTFTTALLVASSAASGSALSYSKQIFKKTFEPQGTSFETLPRLYTEKFEKKEIDSCIESLCGPASTNQSDSQVIETRLNVPSLSAKQVWQDQFQGQLVELFKTEKKNRLAEAQLLARALKSEKSLNFSDAQKVWLSFVEIVQKIAPKSQEFIAWDLKTFAVILNAEKTEEFLATFPSEKRKAVRLVLEKFYLPSFRQRGTDPLENPIVRRTKLKYPNMNEKEARMADAKMLLSVVEKVEDIFGKRVASYFVDDYAKGLFLKAKKGAELSAEESRNYIQLATTLDIADLLYNDADVFNTLVKIPFRGEERLKDLIESGYTKKNLEYIEGINVENETAVVSDSCSSMLTAAIDLNVSELRLRRLPKMIEEVKKSARVVAARFSDELFKAAVEQVDNSQFSFPKTDEENIESIRSAFAVEKRRVKNVTASLRDSRETRQLILFLAIAKKGLEPEDFSKNSVIFEACKALPSSAISDFAVTSSGTINVSWYTAAYPEIGVSIIAHEIGHVVSKGLKMMQKTDYVDSLNCVAHRNPFIIETYELTPFTNTTWSDEDWADYFASLVLKDMEKRGSPFAAKANMGCGLVTQRGNSYFGNDLSPGEGDTHSSGFLRLLNIATDRDQMTPQCSHFLKSVSAAGRKLKCE